MNRVLVRALRCPTCGAEDGKPCTRIDGKPASRSHTSRTPVQPCGTYGGYQRHRRAGEEACDPCRDANRRYASQYRTNNPDAREADIEALYARRRATRRLIDSHRDEFNRLLAEEAS